MLEELEKEAPSKVKPIQEEPASSPSIEEQFQWDAFISHASEDKESFVRKLAQELTDRGIRIWYDEFTLSIGDSLRQSIDNGLAKSKYGIVVLSPRFFEKDWPQKELDGLEVRERYGVKVILPVWLDVNADDVAHYSPLLAGRLAARASEGLGTVVAELLRVLKPNATMEQPSTAEAQKKLNGALEIAGATCRISREQADEMGKTLSRIVGLDYKVEGASNVEAILYRSVRMVVREYRLISDFAIALNRFSVETDPVGHGFILKGNPDVCLFAEQLIRGERPHIPELD
ncbi:MAG: toll/interleukin-1 receptor domain-containing protein [Dehalococcoidia bacterium]